MRFSTVLALVLGSTGVAAAQPDSDAPPPVPDRPPAPPATAPIPPPPPPPPAADVADRPTELAFGIGVGYVLPTSLETPNATSARVRFVNGVQLEPRLVFGNSSTNNTNAGTSTSDGSSEVGLGALVRFPVINHRRIDFELIGSLGFDLRRVNPDGDNNNTTDTTLDLSWGIGIGYWFTPHWNMSFTATNALVTYTAHTQQEPPPQADNKTSTTSIGVVFAPQVSVMIHLYN